MKKIIYLLFLLILNSCNIKRKSDIGMDFGKKSNSANPNIPPAVNHPPVIGNLIIVGNEDTSLSGTLVATDADGDTLTYSVTQNPTHGTLVLNPNGTQQSPLLSANIGTNINYLLGLSLDVNVPTSPLINVGLNSNLLNSLGLGNLRLCLLNLIGINCSNTIENYMGSEDNSSNKLNHAQLMIEWED